MINISLPFFYDNKDFNDAFYIFIKDNPDALKYSINIESYYGAFPFCIWNGGHNSNTGLKNILLREEVNQHIRASKAPLRFDFSSNILVPENFYNNYENIICELGDNCGNLIEISDFRLLEFLEKKYKFQYVLSPNANIFYEPTPEVIDGLADKFYLISVPNYIDLDLFDKYKNKVEVTLFSKCQNCPKKKQQECIVQEQTQQYLFSENSVYNNCFMIKNYYNNYDAPKGEVDLMNALIKGYTHFKIDFPAQSSLAYFNTMLMEIFIKKEYYAKFFALLNRQRGLK